MSRSDETPTPEERTWAMLAHMLTLAGMSFIAPLVIWFVKKDDSEFVADQAKESLNFQITIFLAVVFGTILLYTLVFSCIAVPFLVLVGLGDVVMAIVAGIRAHEGHRYRYPFAFRVVK